MKVLAALAVLIMLSGAAMAQRIGPEYKLVDGSGSVIFNAAAGQSFTPRVEGYVFSTDGPFTISGWTWDAARTDFNKQFPTFSAAVADTGAYSLADMVMPFSGKIDMIWCEGDAGTEQIHVVWYK